MHTGADHPAVRARRQAGAEGEPWPTPRPLASTLAEVCPFDPDLLPESLRAWVLDLAERLQVPPDYPGAALTVMLAGAIGRRALVRPQRHDPWVVNPNLWGTIVGRSGVLKSPVLRAALGPLRRRQEGIRCRRGTPRSPASFDSPPSGLHQLGAASYGPGP